MKKKRIVCFILALFMSVAMFSSKPAYAGSKFFHLCNVVDNIAGTGIMVNRLSDGQRVEFDYTVNPGEVVVIYFFSVHYFPGEEMLQKLIDDGFNTNKNVKVIAVEIDAAKKEEVENFIGKYINQFVNPIEVYYTTENKTITADDSESPKYLLHKYRELTLPELYEGRKNYSLAGSPYILLAEKKFGTDNNKEIRYFNSGVSEEKLSNTMSFLLNMEPQYELHNIKVPVKYMYSKAYEALDYINSTREEGKKLHLHKWSTDFAMKRASELVVYYGDNRPNGDYWRSNAEKEHIYQSYHAGNMEEVIEAYFNDVDYKRNIGYEKYIGIGCVYNNGQYYWDMILFPHDLDKWESEEKVGNVDVEEVCTIETFDTHINFKPSKSEINLKKGQTDSFLINNVNKFESIVIPDRIRDIVDKDDNSKIIATSSIDEKTGNINIVPKAAGKGVILIDRYTDDSNPISVNINVEETALEESWFNVDTSNINYNGTEITKEITNTENLVENTDYKVEYLNNINAGTAKILIKGIGLYVGTIEKTFTISEKEISINSVEILPKTYDGNNIAKVGEVKFDGVATTDNLSRDVDYTINATYDTENVGEDKPVNVIVELINKNYKLNNNTYVGKSSVTKSDKYNILLSNLEQEKGNVVPVGWTIEPKDETAKVEVEYGVTSGSAIIWNNELPTEIGEYQVRARLVESSNLIPSGKEADVEGTLVIKEKYVPPFNPGGGGGAGGGTGGGSGSGGGQSPGLGDDKKPENPAEPIVEVGTDEEGNVIADVTVPEDEPITTVEVPVDLGEEPGTVIIEITTEDGTTEEITALYKDGKVIVKLEENAKVKIISEVAPLNDLPTFVDTNNHWAKDYIDKAVQLGIFKGKSETNFGAQDNMTREQMWMVISRLKGKGQATMEDARNWAMANEVSDGSNPKGDVTREQLVTLIWRALGESKSTYDISQYSDYQNISSWAKEAFAWAVEIGLVNGTSATTLSPHGTATRAQLATILARLIY